MGKLGMLVGFGAGYVLGARAGRERYEQIMGKMRKVKEDPRVEAAAEQAVGVAAAQAQHARESASDLAAQAGAMVKEKTSEAMDKAKEQVRHGDSPEHQQGGQHGNRLSDQPGDTLPPPTPGSLR